MSLGRLGSLGILRSPGNAQPQVSVVPACSGARQHPDPNTATDPLASYGVHDPCGALQFLAGVTCQSSVPDKFAQGHRVFAERFYEPDARLGCVAFIIGDILRGNPPRPRGQRVKPCRASRVPQGVGACHAQQNLQPPSCGTNNRVTLDHDPSFLVGIPGKQALQKPGVAHGKGFEGFQGSQGYQGRQDLRRGVVNLRRLPSHRFGACQAFPGIPTRKEGSWSRVAHGQGFEGYQGSQGCQGSQDLRMGL